MDWRTYGDHHLMCDFDTVLVYRSIELLRGCTTANLRSVLVHRLSSQSSQRDLPATAPSESRSVTLLREEWVLTPLNLPSDSSLSRNDFPGRSKIRSRLAPPL